MTSPLEADGPLTHEFPGPGRLLATAYNDLYLADHGTRAQKKEIKDPARLPRP